MLIRRHEDRLMVALEVGADDPADTVSVRAGSPRPRLRPRRGRRPTGRPRRPAKPGDGDARTRGCFESRAARAWAFCWMTVARSGSPPRRQRTRWHHPGWRSTPRISTRSVAAPPWPRPAWCQLPSAPRSRSGCHPIRYVSAFGPDSPSSSLSPAGPSWTGCSRDAGFDLTWQGHWYLPRLTSGASTQVASMRRLSSRQ